MSSPSSTTGAQLNQKIDSLPPVVAEKLPHVPESKVELKADAKEAGKKSLAGLRSLAAGGFGGVCAVIVGHPFDLVKVRLQTAERGVYSSALDVVRKSIARDGLRRGLYAGVSAPLVGVTPMCMLIFVFWEQELTMAYSRSVLLGI
jgi:solute carrier family 25 (mitochondrial carnitine/acylcarnitine transporter), member 20/29